MAKRSSRSTDPDADAAAQRAGDVNEKILELSRRAGLSSLNLYEKTLKTIADVQQSVGEASRVQWLVQISAAQANFTRELAEIQTAMARELLRS